MFWYLVKPLMENKWSIVFDTQRRPFIYDSRDEAVKAADKAAKGNFTKRGTPSGVRVMEGKDWQDVATYGNDKVLH